MNFKNILDYVPHKTAYAHCDIPCGIYDPNAAQMSAHTIVRMTQLLGQIDRENETKAEHNISRLTLVKEKHGEILEHELVTLRYDYFKEEHFSKYQELENLFNSAIKLDVKARQGIDIDSSIALLGVVMQISEIFYKSKGLECARVKSPYPTELDIVVQK